MQDSYYDTARTEIMPWLPPRVARMLDVGCGAGATTAAVRQVREVSWAGGVEYVEAVAARAESVCDRVWRGDAAAVPLEEEIVPGSLDLVLCLDVLEHMADPWSMVRRLSVLLGPDGRLIVSVPNIRHWKFVWRLASRGDFVYRDAGLLDRTHLRFFVRSTAVELATCGGLKLIGALPAQAWPMTDPRRLLSTLSGGAFDEWMAKQWLVIAEKGADTSA
jgi:2-polyprenyl-3-methyl-5-hydroxy-6-metoxy-1,4-benzoquinol methylase